MGRDREYDMFATMQEYLSAVAIPSVDGYRDYLETSCVNTRAWCNNQFAREHAVSLYKCLMR